MTDVGVRQNDGPEARYRESRVAHWDQLAVGSARQVGLASGYHRRLAQIYRLLIPPGRRVLEIGCGAGDLLAGLEPEDGVGIDFSSKMVEEATRSHPSLKFIHADAHEMDLDEKFDFVILSDLVNELWDVQRVFEHMRQLCHPGTRLIVNCYSRLWEPPLAIARRQGFVRPMLRENWLTVDDLGNLLDLAGFEVTRDWSEFLWPIRTPLIETICNRFLVKIWPISHLALTNMIVARPKPQPLIEDKEPIVSVVVPARNEAGNISEIMRRIPEMGGGTEIIFVEGHSSDDTYTAIEKVVADNPDRRCQFMRQAGTGKGDAVRLGYEKATGEVLMILDADMTVPPEDLPRFYEALRSGVGEFINGVRLVYPMENEAMRFFNLLGNKFFSMAFTWLLGQPIKDTLCGTKVLWKRDYEHLVANRAYFGDFDPFGDFDLLFGAAKLNMKIIDLPVRYRARTYGETNIDRWRHGWALLKMAGFAALRIKFV